VGVWVVVRFHFVLEVTQFFLELPGFLFQGFDTLFDFRMFVAVLLDWHERTSKAQGILAPSSTDFKSRGRNRFSRDDG